MSFLISSEYNRSYTYNLLDEYHDNEATSKVYEAMLLLSLAMVAKAILTIFTFGIKVLYYFNFYFYFKIHFKGTSWFIHPLNVCGGVCWESDWNRNGTNCFVRNFNL